MTSVLFVDDDPFMREIADVVLRNGLGIDVVFASDATEAIEIAASGASFNLIILDLVMPREDGISLFGRLRNNPCIQHTPVAFISARFLDEECSALLDAGVVTFLTKPITPSKLKSEVISLLRLGRSGAVASPCSKEPLVSPNPI
ncbi:response regulator [Tardiphaga sp. vice352]|uniref:response regulator n=1 Tax=unclassified Tardiphaga TaxID=2631404 RepID=UPI001163CCCC|nr:MULTISPECIES: response regulator [unclassified Tardiphaga]QDM15707.1 response regulator [Tardiphaga sp. vice278]QDM20808.1 response regulator [Tardiphaga sp. vice154]QDM31052.1 response regulator [Tardiphaga sp. vice352]